ncbi:ABC transporter permease [Peribacillus kribbensis]|uniref:ABC transporter permease n=1 Tax=Peribacillus kribbensis TaxID=356658 RepID=UPI000418BF79|nr:ABC transporter permease [Peribacillus kribbensis]
MTANDLWRERFRGFTKETGKYLKYIFNGHFAFVLIFAVGGLSYYYSQWVKTLSSDFPAGLIMAAVFGLMLTISPVFTFLKEADIVFLLPMETRLNPYMAKSRTISFVFQGYLLLMVLAAFMPMHAKVNAASFGDFIIGLILLLVLKYVNIQIRWQTLYYPDNRVLLVDSVIRLCLNIAFLYLYFDKAPIVYPVVIACALLFLLMYFKRDTSGKPLKWERLISMESKRMSAFYRIANLFTDVPKLKERAVRRKWLDWIVSAIPYKQESSYSYLYSRTFLRSNDYLGLSVRLTVIGIIISLIFASVWAKAITVLLFLYLTGIQLLPLAKHHNLKIWIDLYPVSKAYRERAVSGILRWVLIVESLLFALAALVQGNVMGAGISLAAGILFMLLFSGYAKRKLAG